MQKNYVFIRNNYDFYSRPYQCTVFERYEIKKIEHCNFIALDKNLEDY